jgi:hypothetical protein
MNLSTAMITMHVPAIIVTAIKDVYIHPLFAMTVMLVQLIHVTKPKAVFSPVSAVMIMMLVPMTLVT